MEFQELDIKGVWLIKPKRYGDSRSCGQDQLCSGQ